MCSLHLLTMWRSLILPEEISIVPQETPVASSQAPHYRLLSPAPRETLHGSLVAVGWKRLTRCLPRDTSPPAFHYVSARGVEPGGTWCRSESAHRAERQCGEGWDVPPPSTGWRSGGHPLTYGPAGARHLRSPGASTRPSTYTQAGIATAGVAAPCLRRLRRKTLMTS